VIAELNWDLEGADSSAGVCQVRVVYQFKDGEDVSNASKFITPSRRTDTNTQPPSAPNPNGNHGSRDTVMTASEQPSRVVQSPLPVIVATERLSKQDLIRIGQEARGISGLALEQRASDAELACQYLDEVAAEATNLANAWRDVVANIEQGTLTGKRAAEINAKYEIILYFDNMGYVSKLTGLRELLPAVAAGRIDAKWTSQFAFQIDSVLTARDASKQELNQYTSELAAIASGKPITNRIDVAELKRSVTELQIAAGRLEALAKAARAVGQVRPAIQ
jgi:hypothetical protein